MHADKGHKIRRWLLARRYYWPLSYGLVYIVLYLAAEHRHPAAITWMHSPIDDAIAFREEFVIAYLLWFPFWLGFIVWLTIRDREHRHEFPRFARLMIIGITICFIAYFVWPTGTQLRPDPYPRTNLLTDLVAVIQSIDTETNVCPSLHVYTTAITNHFLLTSRYVHSRWLRAGSVILTVAICASTVFLKQHSILDVFAALALYAVMICTDAWVRLARSRTR